jgi:hypothetical protein
VISAAYKRAITDVAGPRLRDLVSYWISDRPGRSDVEAAGEAAYGALDRLPPGERAACFFDGIRLMHFHLARWRPSRVKWPAVPLTSIDEARLPLEADVPTIDLSEWIIDLLHRLSRQDLAFSEAMLRELLVLMRDPNGRLGVFCLPLLDHLEAAAAGGATEQFGSELRATAAWLEANLPGHEEDYWARFYTAAARRLAALKR